MPVRFRLSASVNMRLLEMKAVFVRSAGKELFRKTCALMDVMLIAACGGGGAAQTVAPSNAPAGITPTYRVPSAERVAQAGGEYNGIKSTNSIDALTANSRYFSLFEVDFSFTADRHLVCMHDWGVNFKRSFGFSLSGPPTLAEFEQYVADNAAFKPCTMKTLTQWLAAHPGKAIIIDPKDGVNDALKYIAENYPGYVSRFIPHIFSPTQYPVAKNLGYDKIIWALYTMPWKEETVLSEAPHMQLYAISMPYQRANPDFIHALGSLGIATYVHVIDNAADARKYKDMGVSEIYTDNLRP